MTQWQIPFVIVLWRAAGPQFMLSVCKATNHGVRMQSEGVCHGRADQCLLLHHGPRALRSLQAHVNARASSMGECTSVRRCVLARGQLFRAPSDGIVCTCNHKLQVHIIPSDGMAGNCLV
jgi:hypothetical protein